MADEPKMGAHIEAWNNIGRRALLDELEKEIGALRSYAHFIHPQYEPTLKRRDVLAIIQAKREAIDEPT